MKRFLSLLLVSLLPLAAVAQDRELISVVGNGTNNHVTVKSKGTGDLTLMAPSTGTVRVVVNGVAEETVSTSANTIPTNNLTVTAGNIAATAGSVSAGTTVTGGTGVIATTGGVTATAGGVTATAGGVTATAGGFKYGAASIETVAAAGSGQGDGPLTAGKFVHLVTASDETKVVTLPTCQAANIGEVHLVLNAVANKFLKLCPKAGATEAINSVAANTCTAMTATGVGGNSICVCQAANQWYCG